MTKGLKELADFWYVLLIVAVVGALFVVSVANYPSLAGIP